MTEPDPGAALPVLLLLEDNPGVRRSLQLLLQGQGFDVRAYASGATLLADGEADRGICLVSDYQLEDMTGIEVLGELRARGWLRPAILITGMPSAELHARATAAGFSQLFEKPLLSFSLASAVRAIRDQAG